MTWTQPYECGTCGSRSVVITVERMADTPDYRLTWVVSCSQGHRLTPVPDMVLSMNWHAQQQVGSPQVVDADVDG